MGTVKYTDDAYTTLSSSVGPTDTTIHVTSSARFSGLLTVAGDYFFVTLAQTATGTKETVKVTNIIGTAWSVVRAIGPNDSNISFGVGDSVTLRVGTNLLTELRSASNQTLALFGTAIGTVNAFSASVGIVPLALVDGMQVNIRSLGENTITAPTFNLNANGAYPITRYGGNTLGIGDISGEIMLRYVASGPRWELLNPSKNDDIILSIKHFGAVGDGSVDDTAAINSAISYVAANRGGKLLVPRGTYKITSRINLCNGLSLIGEASFSGSTGSPPVQFICTSVTTTECLLGNDVSNVTIEDIYISGPSSGSQSNNIISFTGSCRRINLRRLVVNSVTTGNGISINSAITFMIENCVAVNSGTGFYIGASCTSGVLSANYANTCTVIGYYILGTYISLNGNAADGNLYGYEISGKSIGLHACGAESSIRSAFFLNGCEGVVIDGFRSYANNQANDTFIGSFVNINNNPKNVVFIGCIDDNPKSGTSTSVSSTDNNVGSELSFVSCDLAKGIVSAIKNTITVANAAQAYASFNGTTISPITPLTSHNVASIVKNGAGDYTINFTNPLPSAYYVTTVNGAPVSGYYVSGGAVTLNASYVTVRIGYGNTPADSALVNVMCIGG